MSEPTIKSLGRRLDRVERENRRLKRAGVVGLAVIAAVVLMGLARRPKPTPVTNPAERLEFPGFSILPPRGEKWFIVEPQNPPLPPNWKYEVVFFKVVGKLHSIHAWVMTGDLRHVADVKSKGPVEVLKGMAADLMWYDSSRFRPLGEARPSLGKCLGYDCVRYVKEAEDLSPRDVPGSVLVLAQEGFVVAHPHSPGSYIWLEYGQRFPLGQKRFPIEAEVEPFLTSLEFTPPR